MKYFLLNKENIFNSIKKIIGETKIKLEFKNFIFYKILLNSGLEDTKHFFIRKEYLNKFNANLREKFKLNKVTIDLKRKKINFDQNFFIKYIKFITSSFFYIFQILISLVRKKKKLKKKFNIIYGPTSRVKNFNQNTIKFFLNENKSLFDLKKSIIIFKHNETKKIKNIILDKDPLYYLCINYLKKKDRISIAINIFKNIFSSFTQLYKSKLSIFVYEEMNQFVFYKKISQKKIIENIFSYWTSNYSSYPLWNFIKCKQIKKISIMDTVGDTFQMAIENSKVKSNNKSSALKIQKYLNFDNLIVPDLNAKKIIQKYTKSEIIVNRKVFFNFNNKKIKLDNEYNIGIFDSNYLKYDYLEFFQDEQNYINQLSFKNISIFIEEVLSVVERINSIKKYHVNCYIKSKNTTKTSKIKLIYRLKEKYKFLHILDHDSNLEKLFPEFKTVISIPFTSPSYFFSASTKRKSIYYDHLNMIKKNYPSKKMLLINNKKSLEKNILKLIKS